MDEQDLHRLQGYRKNLEEQKERDAARVGGLDQHLLEKNRRQTEQEKAREAYAHEHLRKPTDDPKEEARLKQEEFGQKQGALNEFLREREKMRAQRKLRPIPEEVELHVMEPGARVQARQRTLLGGRPSLLKPTDNAPNTAEPSSPSFPPPPAPPPPDFYDQRPAPFPPPAQDMDYNSPFYEDDF